MRILQFGAIILAAYLVLGGGAPAFAVDEPAPEAADPGARSLPGRILLDEERPKAQCELDQSGDARGPACQALEREARAIIEESLKEKDINKSIDQKLKALLDRRKGERELHSQDISDLIAVAKYIKSNTSQNDLYLTAASHYLSDLVQIRDLLGGEGATGVTGGKPVRAQSDRAYQVEIAEAGSGALFHKCAGVLLNRWWIFTAQHCTFHHVVHDVARTEVRNGASQDVHYKDEKIIPYDKAELVVHAGTPKLTEPDGITLNKKMRSFSLAEIVRMDGCIASSGNRPPKNDLALLRLATPVPEDNELRFRPVDYLMHEPPEKSQVTAAGWGATEVRTVLEKRAMASVGRYDPMSPILQQVSLEVVPKDMCLDKLNAALKAMGWSTLGALPDDVFCAEDLSSPKNAVPQSTCGGDSGGPVVTRGMYTSMGADSEKSVWVVRHGQTFAPLVHPDVLVGIIGWSIGCGHAPGVYTRVVDHLKWISSVVDPPRSTLKSGN